MIFTGGSRSSTASGNQFVQVGQASGNKLILVDVFFDAVMFMIFTGL